MEELREDISILTHSAYTNFDNDAASCYDWILISVATLSGRKYGVHKNIAYVHAATLKEAEYKFKLSSKRQKIHIDTVRNFQSTVLVKAQETHH